MRKIIDWFFYIIGVLFIGTLLHELYHWTFCGGDFVAGFYLKNGQPIVGLTWCATDRLSGELLPTLTEVLFYIVFIFIKLKEVKKC